MLVFLKDCSSRVTNSCLAFTPPVDNFFDLFQNVLFLRLLVLLIWFPFLPLIVLAKKCPFPLNKVGIFRDNWYEICYYSHIGAAVSVLGIALIVRFEVFYPVIISWALYVMDKLYLASSVRRISLESHLVYARSETGMPTSMRLKFTPTKKGKLRVDAGQWLYLQVPEIDLTWHSFSLASASTDTHVELHVGIIAKAKHWSKGESKVQWMCSANTWTAKLFTQVNKPNPVVNAKVMGPFGINFSSCFNPRFGGSVVIGAGTGLTAAER